MSKNEEKLDIGDTKTITVETGKDETFYDVNADQYLIISPRQKLNPVLKKINRVRYKFNNIVPDFLIGKNNACLFISMKYHRLRSNYLKARIETLSNKYNNRILLCLVDIENIENSLGEINQLAFCFNMTLILCWSNEECAKVLEDFKIYEKKIPYMKNSKPFSNHEDKIHELLKRIRCINSTDCATITNKFKKFTNIVKAKKHDLINCSGLGNKKIQALLSTFNDPFF
ncbi:ERCC1 nucleotide excision repair protein, putative [Plasmodium ovale]|uniref:ERCC1 nucleotide excision repair protein, putative n=2 Tax=Plasmodium ovale TaxID=36330 RepID=A0A1A8VNN3_PLAOA|nr:ERCC1 nucleotide excision repair protein, putative [Plasmodium ovale curtisi]SBS82160.1 ERCC1 nucleotide excision repair protein, putative [Plasmodium ovale curtisi]SCN43185.1 ERCC1 nucleotide excision repair protein, putative [Plasmodium ovale]